jgi:hypothetical protein
MLRHLAVLTLLSVASLATAAGADVIYTFSGVGMGTGPLSFTATLPSLMADNSLVGLNPATVSANCGPNACSPNLFMCGDCDIFGGTEFDVVEMNVCFDDCTRQDAEEFVFTDGSMESFGTHTSLIYGEPGTLTISTAVPEPSSILLLGTGALGLFGPIRRKFGPGSQA